MDWETLKAQHDRAVRDEAVKAIDQAIERLQQLRAEYTAAGTPPPAAIPLEESPFSPPEQRTQETRSADFWSPERTAARSQTQQERRQHEKQEAAANPKQYDPKACMVCRTEFTPTHHLQKKCESCRTAAAAQGATLKRIEPRHCRDCGAEFVPTDGRQKTGEKHRTNAPSKLMKSVGNDYGLTPEEKEWKRYGESVASKLAKRPDAPVLPGRA